MSSNPVLLREPAVEEMPPLAILDFHNPHVGIELGFSNKPSVHGRLAEHGYPAFTMLGYPDAVGFHGVKTGWGGDEQKTRPVETVHLDENRARIVVAMTYDESWDMG